MALPGAEQANRRARLTSAYHELGRQISSGKMRVVGNYTLQRFVGQGSYGKVRLATHRLTNTRVAVKQIPKAHIASLTREIHHHRRLHHPHVVQLLEVLETESYIWMVSELCSGGELYDYLVERGSIPEPEARMLFGQLCLAVAYIHSVGIVHRDLKLENILLDEDCNVKLSDFGFTREFEARQFMHTRCGTTAYAAPEMLAGYRYLGQEVDIWSLGVILYVLLCGYLPFDDDDERMMRQKIIVEPLEIPDTLSNDAHDLLATILQKNNAARPSVHAILSHPWFTRPGTVYAAPAASVQRRSPSVHGAETGRGAASGSSTPSRPRAPSVPESPAGMQILPPPDFVAMLVMPRPEPFTSPLEQRLFRELSDLGMAVGQIHHSVMTHACDSTGALWWLLVRRAEAQQRDTAWQPEPAVQPERPDPLSRTGSFPRPSAPSTPQPDRPPWPSDAQVASVDTSPHAPPAADVSTSEAAEEAPGSWHSRQGRAWFKRVRSWLMNDVQAYPEPEVPDEIPASTPQSPEAEPVSPPADTDTTAEKRLQALQLLEAAEPPSGHVSPAPRVHSPMRVRRLSHVDSVRSRRLSAGSGTSMLPSRSHGSLHSRQSSGEPRSGGNSRRNSTSSTVYRQRVVRTPTRSMITSPGSRGAELPNVHQRRRSLDETNRRLQQFPTRSRAASQAATPERRLSGAESEPLQTSTMFVSRRSSAFRPPSAASEKLYAEKAREPRPRPLPRNPSVVSSTGSSADEPTEALRSSALLSPTTPAPLLAPPPPPAAPRRKRDVFGKGATDDGWIDEDDDALYHGGLGQQDLRSAPRADPARPEPRLARKLSPLPGAVSHLPWAETPGRAPVPAAATHAGEARRGGPFAATYPAMLGPPVGAASSVRGHKGMRNLSAPVIEEEEAAEEMRGP